MTIDEVKIRRAVGWNNGQAGGKEYWVVYVNGDEAHPWVSESLEYILNWMKEQL